MKACTRTHNIYTHRYTQRISVFFTLTMIIFIGRTESCLSKITFYCCDKWSWPKAAPRGKCLFNLTISVHHRGSHRRKSRWNLNSETSEENCFTWIVYRQSDENISHLRFIYPNTSILCQVEEKNNLQHILSVIQRY